MSNTHFLALVAPGHPDSFASMRTILERHRVEVEPHEVKRFRHISDGSPVDGLLCCASFPDGQVDARLKAIAVELAPNLSDIDWHNGDKVMHRIVCRR